jgi:hypothetical protein
MEEQREGRDASFFSKVRAIVVLFSLPAPICIAPPFHVRLPLPASTCALAPLSSCFHDLQAGKHDMPSWSDGPEEVCFSFSAFVFLLLPP